MTDEATEKMPPPSLTIDNRMVAWTPKQFEKSPTRGKIEVGPWPDTVRWTNRYMQADGCSHHSWHELPLMEKAMHLLFIQLRCVDDGIDAMAAHREFMRIAEYRTWAQFSTFRPFYRLGTKLEDIVVSA